MILSLNKDWQTPFVWLLWYSWFQATRWDSWWPLMPMKKGHWIPNSRTPSNPRSPSPHHCTSPSTVPLGGFRLCALCSERRSSCTTWWSKSATQVTHTHTHTARWNTREGESWVLTPSARLLPHRFQHRVSGHHQGDWRQQWVASVWEERCKSEDLLAFILHIVWWFSWQCVVLCVCVWAVWHFRSSRGHSCGTHSA